MQNTIEPSDWLTPLEAAAAVRIGPRTIYRAIQSKSLRATKINGRDYRINKAWLMDFMERGEVGAEAVSDTPD